MEVINISLYSSLFFLFTLFAFKILQKSKTPKNLPPSPPALPIIGHFHLLRQPLHRTFHSLSSKYGPIFYLRFGSRRMVVISSQSGVEECFGKNDVALADRPRFISGKHVAYNYTTIVTASYGDHWRNLRRLAAVEIFSSNRLNMFLAIRRDEINSLVKKLYGIGKFDFADVELKPLFHELTFNNIMRMIAGKRYYGKKIDSEVKKVREVIKEHFESSGASNPADFLPKIFQWFDIHGMEKKIIKLGKKMDAFLQGLIDEHRKDRGRNTMINHLLSLQESQPEYYTDQIIKGLIQVLLFAGTDTSVVTLEWAMSNLLNNPHVLQKAKTELAGQVGQERLMDEPDLSKLPYLQNIISETLRLCPPTPLLVPHMSRSDCTIQGYDIPRGTILLVNVWELHRNPNLWKNPLNFQPERFENDESEKDAMGHKLLPFGIGRRACPGVGLANRIVGLTLGSLIQCFEWERIGAEEIDMMEGKGLTMPKAHPLVARCKARDFVKKIIE